MPGFILYNQRFRIGMDITSCVVICFMRKWNQITGEKKKMKVNEIEYEVIRLLGHGKGGYSYLVKRNHQFYVLKQIHHEPCDYYTFSNKIESEYRDYQILKKTGIPIPKMLDIDYKEERILKEYIEGETIYNLVKNNLMKKEYMDQIYKISNRVTDHGINIDYFPTNFIVQNEILYYIDYECNPYMEQWNFENWGIQYWSKTDTFEKHDKEKIYDKLESMERL